MPLSSPSQAYAVSTGDSKTAILRGGVRLLSPILAWKRRNHRVLYVDLSNNSSSLIANAPAKPVKASRLVCISDIHTLWDYLDLPQGDTLLIAGDLFLTDKRADALIAEFQAFVQAQSSRYKEIIVIAGNHDRILQRLDKEDVQRRFLPALYLENDRVETADGISVFGSPWSAPEQTTHTAFQFPNEESEERFLRPLKELPPGSVDVLLTHSVGGSPSPLAPILQKLQPHVHLSGHYHSRHGVRFQGGIASVNAASLNGLYLPLNPVVVIDIAKHA